MAAIDSLRKEFYNLLKDTGLVDSNPTTWNVWSYDEHLLRAIICYGLFPGICSVVVSYNLVMMHFFPVNYLVACILVFDAV